MNEEIIIRQAKLYDVPAMARIERDSFESPWSAEEITKDVTSGGSVYVAVAECGGEKGEELLRHMTEKAEADGGGLATLEVRGSNKAAMELYTKLGFREVGRRRGYYSKGGEDAVLMDLDLRKVEVEVEIETL